MADWLDADSLNLLPSTQEVPCQLAFLPVGFWERETQRRCLWPIECVQK